LCGNDLKTLLDFCGSPQNDAMERVMGIEDKTGVDRESRRALIYIDNSVYTPPKSSCFVPFVPKIVPENRG
jgi:hypothetical protein